MSGDSADASVARGFAYLAMIPVRFVADGWALWQLWLWFIVPLGLRPLAFWQAVGIDTLVGLFVLMGVAYREPDARKRFELFIGRCLGAPLAVLTGWVALLLWRHM